MEQNPKTGIFNKALALLNQHTPVILVLLAVNLLLILLSLFFNSYYPNTYVTQLAATIQFIVSTLTVIVACLFVFSYYNYSKKKKAESILHGGFCESFEHFQENMSIIFDSETPDTNSVLHLLMHALEQSPASIIITDINGTIKYVNKKFTEITGYTFSEAIGKNPRILKSNLFAPNQYKELWDTLLAGNEWHGVFLNHKKNTEKYWESASISPLKNEKGVITHFIAVKEDITDKKKLDAERQLLTNSINASINEIYIFNAQSLRFEFANQSALNNLGYTAAQFHSMTPVDILPEFSHDVYVRALEPLRQKEGSIIDFETIHKRADGTIYPISIQIQYIKQRDENVFLAVGLNLSERKINEKRINENEQRYKSLFHNNQTAILLIDPEHNKIIDVNYAAIRFYGYSYQDLIEMKLNELIVPEPTFITEHNRALRKKSHFLVSRHRLASGEERDVELYCGKILYEDNELSYLIVHDITKLKQAELDLKYNQQRMLRAEKVAKTGNWEIDLKTKLVRASNGAKIIYGFTSLDVETFSLAEIARVPLPEYRPMLDKALNELINNNTPYNVEFRIKRTYDNKIIYVQSIAEYDPKSMTIFGVIQDVTKIKEYENDLLEAKAKAEENDRLKSAFLANMSHEIRTPMNGIIGFAELLQKDSLEPEKRKHYTNLISQSTQRLMALVNDVLDMSKIESGQLTLTFTKINLDSFLLGLHQFFKPRIEQKQLSLLFEPAIHELSITTEKTRLLQILTNLINNALKFTEKGHIRIGYTADETYVTLFVEDTGIGIAPDKLHLVFERFVQVHESKQESMRGTGLGLAISKSLTEMLGGKIWVESQPGIGSTFYVQLPIEPIENEIE